MTNNKTEKKVVFWFSVIKTLLWKSLLQSSLYNSVYLCLCLFDFARKKSIVLLVLVLSFFSIVTTNSIVERLFWKKYFNVNWQCTVNVKFYLALKCEGYRCVYERYYWKWMVCLGQAMRLSGIIVQFQSSSLERHIYIYSVVIYSHKQIYCEGFCRGRW